MAANGPRRGTELNTTRNDPGVYRDLMARLNHAPTGQMTVSDIAFLKQLFQHHWWRIPKEDRDKLGPPYRTLFDGQTLVERLRSIADKCGV